MGRKSSFGQKKTWKNIGVNLFASIQQTGSTLLIGRILTTLNFWGCPIGGFLIGGVLSGISLPGEYLEEGLRTGQWSGKNMGDYMKEVAKRNGVMYATEAFPGSVLLGEKYELARYEIRSLTTVSLAKSG